MKTLYSGAGVALAAGLLMGAAMKPDLAADDRPAGPQIVADAARQTGPFDDAVTYAAYAGQTPDYVLGTDWKRIAYQASEAAAPALARLRDESQPPHEPEPAFDERDLTPAVYDARAAEDAAVEGSTREDAYEDASRAEKTPLTVERDIDPEAPPAATGDTRRAR